MFLDFEYQLPSGQVVLVEAEVTEGMRGRAQTTEFAGEPDEDPVIELLSTTIEGKDIFTNIVKEIDLEGLWFRKFGSLEMINVLDDIQDLAWEKYSVQLALATDLYGLKTVEALFK